MVPQEGYLFTSTLSENLSYGDPKASKETVLEDSTDIMLNKFPTLKNAIIKLQTEDFKEFVESIDWVSPRPTSFRVNLK